MNFVFRRLYRYLVVRNKKTFSGDWKTFGDESCQPASPGRFTAIFALKSPHGIVPDYGRGAVEDQLGALGLVVNMIVFWNTLYIQKALPLAEHGHGYS